MQVGIACHVCGQLNPLSSQACGRCGTVLAPLFYVLLGALLAGEFLFRKWWFRYYGAGPVDRVFARLFPAEATPNGRRSLAYVAARRQGMTRAHNSPTLGPDDGRHSPSSA